MQSVRLVLGALLVLVLSACERGPDAHALLADITSQLESRFEPGVFRLVAVERAGSTPLAANEVEGEKDAGVLVYFTAELEFLRDYDFSQWQGLSPASLARVLGASEEGVIGLSPSGNKAGDRVRIYGTGAYAASDHGWRHLVAPEGRDADVPRLDLLGVPTTGGSLVDELLRMLGLSAEDPRQKALVARELDVAVRAVRLRLDRDRGIFTLVTGSEDGEYERFGRLIERYVSAPGVTVHQYTSQGSVENAKLVHAFSADLALVQNDIAAMAYHAEGPFAGFSALSDLRALGSLFPEPFHIVVRAASDIRTPSDLIGHRVNVGEPLSGSRVNSLMLLELLGIAPGDLAELREMRLREAAEGLRTGGLDAVMTTRAAPARLLQGLAEATPIRLLSIAPETLARVKETHPYLVPFAIPARTYAGQAELVTTFAATALTVTHRSMPDERVTKLLQALHDNVASIASRSFRGYRVSRRSTPLGVSIPWHPAARRFYRGDGG